MGGGEAFARSSSIKERWLFVLRVGHDFFFWEKELRTKGMIYAPLLDATPFFLRV